MPGRRWQRWQQGWLPSTKGRVAPASRLQRGDLGDRCHQGHALQMRLCPCCPVHPWVPGKWGRTSSSECCAGAARWHHPPQIHLMPSCPCDIGDTPRCLAPLGVPGWHVVSPPGTVSLCTVPEMSPPPGGSHGVSAGTAVPGARRVRALTPRLRRRTGKRGGICWDPSDRGPAPACAVAAKLTSPSVWV